MIVVFKHVNDFLEYTFEDKLNSPAANTCDWARWIRVSTVVFPPSYSLFFWVPLPESEGAIFLIVFDLLSNNIYLTAIDHFPVDPHITNLFLPLRELSTFGIFSGSRIQVIGVSFGRKKLLPPRFLHDFGRGIYSLALNLS